MEGPPTGGGSEDGGGSVKSHRRLLQQRRHFISYFVEANIEHLRHLRGVINCVMAITKIKIADTSAAPCLFTHAHSFSLPCRRPLLHRSHGSPSIGQLRSPSTTYGAPDTNSTLENRVPNFCLFIVILAFCRVR